MTERMTSPTTLTGSPSMRCGWGPAAGAATEPPALAGSAAPAEPAAGPAPAAPAALAVLTADPAPAAPAASVAGAAPACPGASPAPAASPFPSGANDLLWPIRDGLVDQSHIHAELGELVAGTKPGRTSEEQLTLYKSVGVAVQDAAAAGLVLRRAREQGLGRNLDM